MALGLWSGLTAYSLPHSHNELTVCMNFHVTPSTRHYDIIKRHLLPGNVFEMICYEITDRIFCIDVFFIIFSSAGNCEAHYFPESLLLIAYFPFLQQIRSAIWNLNVPIFI